MAHEYSVDDLIDFLEYAGDCGLLPATTAQTLTAAARTVLGVLDDDERQHLDQQDLDVVVDRFTEQRGKDFYPSSIREYARRVHRAVGLFRRWREDPDGFGAQGRASSGARRRERAGDAGAPFVDADDPAAACRTPRPGRYHSALAVRPGVVVTLSNVPCDLTGEEAERLATFVRMLVVTP
ncbi:MAG: hypothetical protein IT361_09440 [Gemmatimonadaceae bacterium]|nr:hypothetical protein [Gemmatimonadaceae bacterium]